MIDETVSQKLIEFIRNDLMVDEVELDDNLLTDLGIDSIGMFRLVGFIESTFAVEISPIQLTIENFKTVTVISQFVMNLRSQE